MKRKIKSHVKVIMLLCIALLMFNCQNEENSSNEVQSKIHTVTIDEAKNFLTHSKTNSFGKSANNVLENLELDKISQEEINGSNQLLTVIPLATNNNLRNDRVLLLKVDNEIKGVVFTMYPDEDSVKGSFSGELFSYSLDGKFISGFRAKDGIIVSYFVENNTAKTTATSAKAIPLNEVIVQNNYRQVYALDMFGYSSIFGNDIYGGDSYGGTDYYSWDPGRGANSAPTPAQIAETLQKQIDGTKLDPCTKAVLDRLKNATNCDIANILNKLNATKTYNVTIISGNSGIVPAATTHESPNNYKIIVSNDRFISSTQLFKASILLHEIGHAFFMSLVDDYIVSQNPSVFSEFPTLFQKYVDTKYPGGKAAAQHEEMANTYVEAIGAALQEFQTGIAVPNGVKPDQVYTDLAWGGLRDAPVYEKKFPVGTAERLRIDNRLASEQTGNTIGAGTPQQQTTIGKPCN